MPYQYLKLAWICLAILVVQTASISATARADVAYEDQIANLQYAGDTDLAVNLAQKYVKATNEKYGSDKNETFRANYILGLALFMDGKYEEAIKVLSASISAFEKKVGVNHPDMNAHLSSLASLYYTVSRFEDGDKTQARASKLKQN